MNNDLRVALRNAMCHSFWLDQRRSESISKHGNLYGMIYALWTLYFKKAHDEFPTYWAPWEDLLKGYVFNCEWHEVYELLNS